MSFLRKKKQFFIQAITMSATELKRKLKQQKELPEILIVRLHRAISWLKAAEEHEKNIDLQFVGLWISFNACYAIDDRSELTLTEREMFSEFIGKLVGCDREGHFFQLLWKKFSGPVRMLIENEYVYKPFWDYQRGQIKDWKRLHQRSIDESKQYLSVGNVAALLEVVLDRLYVLRNQLLHGGATYKSKVNRSQLRDGCNMLKLLVPLTIELMLNNSELDWGKVHYPVIG